jgi:hypothetical protein
VSGAMESRNGGERQPSPNAPAANAQRQLGRYPANPNPRKTVRYLVDGRLIMLKGQRVALADALIAAKADGDGVASIELAAIMRNPQDGLKALRRCGIRIPPPHGKPALFRLECELHRLELEQ